IDGHLSMELQDWRKEPRKNYSNEFKPYGGTGIATRELVLHRVHGKMASMIMNIFKWLGLGRT
ncbi:hypothetical protein O6A27_27740, partial [Escherichia coli]|nr:hypothetical protein [Escherichia coli]